MKVKNVEKLVDVACKGLNDVIVYSFEKCEMFYNFEGHELKYENCIYVDMFDKKGFYIVFENEHYCFYVDGEFHGVTYYKSYENKSHLLMKLAIETEWIVNHFEKKHFN